MRSWLAAHRPLLATVMSGTVIAAIVAAVAIVSNGYTAQKMELGDGSVWVANGDARVIGRANTQVLELNTIVRGESTELEVLQAGTTVLFVDRANATLTPVDPATSQAGESIALPPQQPRVWVTGDRVVVFAEGTGELWIVPIADLETFDATSVPTLSLGLGALVSVASDGVLFAYSPESDQVFRVRTAVSDEVDGRWPVALDAAASALELSSVAGSWVLFDRTAATLTTETRTIDFSEALDSGLSAQLQSPSTEGDRALIATSGALIAVPLGGGSAETLVDGRTGVPAKPLVLDGCAFAAWSVGTAWRDCPGEDPKLITLQSTSGGGALAFVVNGHQAVLNDARRGGVWAVQQNGELIDNWQELIEQEDEQDEVEENSDDDPPEVEADQKPPVAADDEFGARPGRATLLPVLLNDYDPNADVLVITEVSPISESDGRLDLVTRNQQLLLTLPADASGSFTFDYSISDGRGGESGATVTVTVRQPGENSPPHQVRESKTSVKSGGRVTTQVIGDWVDPDGDAFYLTAASAASPDQASYKPDGVVVFSDSGDGTGVKTVGLVMSDGREDGTGSLRVTVRPVGEVPIVVEPWILLATAGQEVTVRPLLHVRGGNGPIRLNAVPAKAGTTTVPSFEAGTFTFMSDEVRTHYMEFTVTDGEATATGLVRIDVAAPPDANTRPVTVPKTIFVTTLSSQTVDPTTTDIDPAGGVLVVTGVVNVPAQSGIQAEVIDQRIVRVSLSKPLDAPVTINYRISNGLAEAEGTITVVEIPRPLSLQPPLANDDSVTVRVGDAIDIPVLENDEQPDGADITLAPDLAQPLPEGAGLLFASGDRLRYLAPQTAGNYTAVYTVEGPDQQQAQARVLISVRERNAATNNPPVPVTVVARVIAGEVVRIEVPLSGIDPDGDAVQLIGQETNPEKGTVLSVGPGAIEYEAGVYSSGTDTFRYTVIDGLGARATGTIRVGISASLEGARNPVANEDTVLVRPGRTVSVQVLANDSDPDGRPLHVQSVVPNTEGTTAEVVEGSVVKITPPDEPGTYAVIYTIANEYGGTSSAFVRVTVAEDAPLAYPIVGDTVLTVSDVLDRDTVDVDVLDNVFFADGDVSELGLSLLDGYSESAELLPNRHVRVTIGQRSQIIPFAVSHPVDPAVRSYGFIWVPGTDDALPQINTKAPPLRVASEDTLVIDLDRYVVALGGSRVRLTDSSTVRATHANGDDLVVDDHTLVFTSADRYFGPASITFEVTDGSPGVDGGGHAAILSLPITVDPRENQPPVFRGGVVDFEPGQEKELDLVRLTDYPYDDVDELEYGVLTPLPVGFSYEINGQRLLLTASAAAVKGTTTAITLSVRDAVNQGESGRITLQVVPSTRPLASPVGDSAITRRGETTVIDVLANDKATNPFPDQPLRVVAIRGLGGSNLPAGVTVSPSSDRSRLTVTVSDTAAPVDTNLQYQVADATGDPDRMVWGNVTISVQDVPDPVTNLRAVEFGDRSLKLAWSPGQFNNSAITEYRIKVLSAADGSTLSTTTCTTTAGCAITTPGNGPSNAVRVSVTAVNAIGESEPAVMPGTIWSDIIPPPPTGVSAVPLDHGLRITWTEPSSSGSPIDKYVVTVNGVVRELSPTAGTTPQGGCSGGVCSRNVRSTAAIPNGSSVSYSVSARNSAPNSLANWNEASGSATPAGAPLSVGSPTATGSVTDGTSATVEWGDAFAGNGKSISRYYVAMYSGAPPSCVVEGLDVGDPVLTGEPSGPDVQQLSGSETSATFGGLLANQTYTFMVFAYNGQGCTSSPEVEATPREAPGTVTGITWAGPIDRGDGVWDFRLDDITAEGDFDSFLYRLSGGDTEGTEYSGDFGDFLTAGTTHYGNDISVQVKACRDYPPMLCSADWSPAFALGTPVRITMNGLDSVETLAPQDGNPGQGYWTWSNAPNGPGYDTVVIECGASDVVETPDCEVTSGPPQDSYPELVVTVTANGDSYTREYSWTEF